MMKTNEQVAEQETRMGSGSLAARGAPSRVHGLDPASPQDLPARRGLSRTPWRWRLPRTQLRLDSSL